MNVAAVQGKDFLKDVHETVLDVVKVFVNHPCCGFGHELISLE